MTKFLKNKYNSLDECTKFNIESFVLMAWIIVNVVLVFFVLAIVRD